MEIQIFHHKVTKDINDDIYFDLEDYEKSSSVNLKNHFVNFISDREYYSWKTVLIGITEQFVIEKLHTLNQIDTTSGLDVIISASEEEFSNYCVNTFIPRYKDNFKRASIYKKQMDESIFKKISNIELDIYCLDLYKQIHTKSTYASLDYSMQIEIPKSHVNKFKDCFLYCKKNDLEIMYKFLKNEYQNEFQNEFISVFEPGISIIEILPG